MRRNCLLEKKQLRENLAKIFNVEYVNGDDKLSIIKQYLINFCAENSLSKFNGNTGYITEKIYDAFGCSRTSNNKKYANYHKKDGVPNGRCSNSSCYIFCHFFFFSFFLHKTF